MMSGDRRRRARILLLILIGGLFLILEALQSNTAHVERFGPSCVSWLARRSWDSSGPFSHGLLLPFVSLGIVWWKRKELAAAAKGTNRWGLAVVAVCLLAHVAGYKMMMPRINLLALIGLLWGMPLYLCGWPMARILLFPTTYLLLGIPLRFVDDLTFPLRLVASGVSAHALNGLGVACSRTGTVIRTTAAGGFSFDVADPCSGLKYVLAITAVAALYAYVIRERLWKRLFIFLTAVPLAVAGNIARIVLIGLVGRYVGRDAALGLYHDWSGYIVFGVVVALMMGTAAALKVNYVERISKWKSAHTLRS
ncbi:MAG: exosortase/archaeosortase family protein [Lentisphaerae bacterium]|nr:exosortase/archaeosortase family protein [Lentisphaerota bacterium]